MTRPLCAHCGERIVSFTVTKDWTSRQLHKSCFNLIEQTKKAIRLYKTCLEDERDAERRMGLTKLIEHLQSQILTYKGIS